MISIKDRMPPAPDADTTEDYLCYVVWAGGTGRFVVLHWDGNNFACPSGERLSEVGQVTHWEPLGSDPDAAGAPGECRITIRCANQPQKHAKYIEVKGLPLADVERLVALLDGSSPYYLRGIGPNSPIGKCATCGARVEVTVGRWELQRAALGWCRRQR